MARRPDLAWHDAIHRFSGLREQVDISTLSTICDANLGSPSVAGCFQAANAFQNPGSEANLNPQNGPWIEVVGNCAISVGFQDVRTVARYIITPTVDYLLETCIGSPVAPRLGGTAISRSSPTQKRVKGGQTIPFPVGMEVGIYREDASATDTCARGIVASHHGDTTFSTNHELNPGGA